jgi:hypothetical protein
MMFLHLGEDCVVSKNDIIGIFDIETTTISKSTKEFLKKAEKKKQIITVSYEIPKSFVVCKRKNKQIVYICGVASSTLLKRARI